MFSKFALSAAIVISAACPALAATKHHHRVTHVHPTIYNMVPDTSLKRRPRAIYSSAH
jgi:uncharacterized protein YcgI (DUF1989 family)